MIDLSYMVPLFVIKMLTMFPLLASSSLEYHLHPDSGIESDFSLDSFNGSSACFTALYSLYEMGADSIVICSVTRIEAPLSGYLVDATGVLSLDGADYSIFRVGIRDGEENADWAGTEFVFLAAGFYDSGEAYLYPPGANAEDPGDNFAWEQEFLLDPEDFFSIPERFGN